RGCRAWAAGRVTASLVPDALRVRPVGVRRDLHVRVHLLPGADLEDAVRDVRPLLREVPALPLAPLPVQEPGVRRIRLVEARGRAALKLPVVPLVVDDAQVPAPVLDLVELVDRRAEDRGLGDRIDVDLLAPARVR